MIRPLRFLWILVREAAHKWSRGHLSRWAAAIAYYAVFSLTPLLMVIIAVTAMFFGQQAARAETLHRLKELIGEQGSTAIQALIENAQRPTTGTAATVVGTLLVLYGATRIFTELRRAFNVIWEVRGDRPVFRSALMDRLLALAMVLGVGLLLVGTLAASTALMAMQRWFVDTAPHFAYFAERVLPGTSFALVFVVFAAIFKVMPAVRVAWRDVWLGALVTTALFTAVKYAIGYYLSRTTVMSVYGAAGSLVVLLLWIYYSVLILLLGGVLTKVYSELAGSRGAARRQRQAVRQQRAASA